MSTVHYLFETPVPTYFRKNGFFKNEKTFKFVTWAFSRCKTIPHSESWDGKVIQLEAFEFICGRNASSAECFLTPKEFRGQLDSLIKLGLIKKRANHRANKYSIYIWSMEHFCRYEGQQKGQQRANRGPTEGHKSKSKEIENKEDDLIDARKREEKPMIDLKGKEIAIDESEIYRSMLTFKFPTEIVQEAITRSKQAKGPITCLTRYIETTCRNLMKAKEKQKQAEEIKQKKQKVKPDYDPTPPIPRTETCPGSGLAVRWQEEDSKPKPEIVKKEVPSGSYFFIEQQKKERERKNDRSKQLSDGNQI